MIDLIIYLMYLVILISIGVTIWSVVRRIIMIGHTSGKIQGIPARKINLSIVLFLFASLTFSYIFADVSPITINTRVYDDVFWLRISNMFVFTGCSFMILGIISMTYSFIKTGNIKESLKSLVIYGNKDHLRTKENRKPL